MKTLQRLLIGSILIITGVFTWLDASVWLARFGSATSHMPLEHMEAFMAWSEGLRFLRTVLAGFILVRVRHMSLGRLDYRLLGLAFLLIVIADFFLILRGQLLVGIGVFALVQVVFIVRQTRGWRNAWNACSEAQRVQRRKPLLLIGGLGVLLWGSTFVALGPRLADVGLLGPTLVYGLLIVLAVCTAWGLVVMRIMPARNAWLIAIGMTLFTVCDITVGMGAALQGQPIGEGARVLTGLFYSPALIVLALSGQRDA